MTPLHWAVEKGHLHAIQLLIKQGADINCENKVSAIRATFTPIIQEKLLRILPSNDAVSCYVFSLIRVHLT